ncbi:MAG TPA: PilW family protein, partial [Marinagarivorans sp.]
PSNGSSEVIGHNTNSGGGNTGDNCANGLKGNFTCPASCAGQGACSDAIEADYLPGSKIMRFVANAYYIGRSNVYAGTALEDTPILFRQELSASGAIKTKAIELAQGIESLNMIYGVDLNGDGEVNQFLKASAMDLDGSGFVTRDEWQAVVAVRLNLVFRSLDPVYPSNQPVTLNNVQYNDRYLRQEFSQTVQLRNHG